MTKLTRIRWTMAIVLSALLVGSAMVMEAASTPRPQQAVQAPTLIPPTPLPRTPAAVEEMLLDQSAVARIRDTGVLRVGILYNEPPFGTLDVRGNPSGFDADLANSLATAWGVETQFTQVTRQAQTIETMLEDGDVDIVLAAMPHDRDLDQRIEFSQTYYDNAYALMVLAEDEVNSPEAMTGRPVGVVIATPAEQALIDWITRSGTPVSVQTYLTLDRAYVALINGEIAGVVDVSHRLARVSAQQPDVVRILEQPISQAPFAIGFRRQDAVLGDLINRTLHYLTATGRMNEIMQVHFPGEVYDAIAVWKNVPDDAPTLDGIDPAVVYPSQYVMPRVEAGGTLRVAGLFNAASNPTAAESEIRLDRFHQLILGEMASRWGVAIDFLPAATGEAALQMVADGTADIAVGVEPDWAWSSRVDFTLPYLLHGERLMVPVDSGNLRFADLRGGRTLITPINETTAVSRATEIAESINARVTFSQQREQDLAFALLSDEDIEAEAVFGDSLKLIPHVQAEPDRLRLTTATDDDPSGYWYSPSYVEGENFAPRLMVMAVPYNDNDFHLLVEYTLQELVREGLLEEWLQPLMLPDDVPSFEIWPGPSTFGNLSLSR